MATAPHVAIYGTSLFATAIAATFRHHLIAPVIQLPLLTTTTSLLNLNLSVVLYQDCDPPRARNRLLDAGTWLIEIDSQQSVVVLYHHQYSRQQVTIAQSADLVAIMKQYIRKGI